MNNSTQPSSQQGHSSKAGGGGAYGNRFVVSDFGKLLRWRRGFGPWDDAMLLAILDIVIPRHAQLKTTVPLDKALAQWVAANMPETIEKHGSAWLEARRLEVMAWESGSFPTIDEIAEHLHITQDEVDGACLCSLRAFDNPERDRKLKRRNRDKARKSESRALKGAKPHSKSAAKAKPWEALGMSRRTFYRKGLNEAPSGDEKPIPRGTDSSATEPLALIRPQQSIYNTGAHDIGQDVSDDWRALIRAPHLAETVELPF